MANCVYNKIITKNEKDFKKLRSLLCDDKTFDVDFNKIIPMHEDLKIKSSGHSWEANKYNSTFEDVLLKIKFQNEVLEPYLSKFYNETITRKEFVRIVKNAILLQDTYLIDKLKDICHIRNIEIKERECSPFETFISGYFNIQRHGEIDWYEWSCTNWGTKCNASETRINEIKSIEFDTEWSCPLPIIKKIAKYIDFTILYVEKEFGSDFNILIAKNGEVNEDKRICNLTSNQKSFLSLLIIGDKPKSLYSEYELIKYYGENWKEDLKVAEEIYNEYI